MTLILSCYNDKTNWHEDETSCDMWITFLHGSISIPSLPALVFLFLRLRDNMTPLLALAMIITHE